MCAIIDTCKLDEFEQNTCDAKRIRALIRKGKLGLVYSTHGRFASELCSKPKALNLFAELARAQKARYITEEELTAKMDELPPKPSLRSDKPNNDDRHILALALASGARLLYTNDGPLAYDFTDPSVINQPRGKVYQTYEQHSALLYPNKLKDLCRTPPQS